MDPNKIRRLPALEEYLGSPPLDLDESRIEAGSQRAAWVYGLGAAALVGLLALPIYGVAVSLFGAAVAGITAGYLKWTSGKRRSLARAPRFEGVDQLKARLAAICQRRRVHREMDAGAAIALESCARSYLQVRRTLTSAAWSGALDENWAMMRAEAMERADDAMDEAIYLCRSWIGEARQARKTNWKRVLGDLLEGDFDDVIERFTERDEDDEDERGLEFRPPLRQSSGFALQPVRQIGQNLKRLAQELEEATSLLGQPQSDAPTQTELEQTLQNLRELKQAESELNDAVQLRLKG